MIKGHYYCSNCGKDEDQTNKSDAYIVACSRCTHPMKFVKSGDSNPAKAKETTPVNDARFLPVGDRSNA